MSDSVISVTKANFQTEITDFPGVVLVDFTAPWCGPCKMMAPHVDKLAEKYKADSVVKVVEINVDEETELSEQFEVFSVPTFVVFAAGKPVAHKTGAVPPPFLEQILEHGRQSLTPVA